MNTASPSEFGTGLRRALERRGALTEARVRFAMLELLVRDDDEDPARETVFPSRSQALRLAT